VVNDDELPVLRQVDVELDHVGAEVEPELERLERVLGRETAGASVSDDDDFPALTGAQVRVHVEKDIRGWFHVSGRGASPMLGLMQSHALNVPTILRHAMRLHPKKTVATRTDSGVTVATFEQVIERSRRLMAALRALGVKPGDRVATFSWNTQ